MQIQGIPFSEANFIQIGKAIKAPAIEELRKTRSAEILNYLMWGLQNRTDQMSENLSLTMKAVRCLSADQLLSESGKKILELLKTTEIVYQKEKGWCCFRQEDSILAVIEDFLKRGNEEAALALLNSDFRLNKKLFFYAMDQNLHQFVLTVLEKNLFYFHYFDLERTFRWASLNGQDKILEVFLNKHRAALPGYLVDEIIENVFERKHRTILALLLTKFPRTSNKFLTLACQSNDIEIIKLLLNKGAKPTGEHLAVAVEKKNKEAVILLLDAGASVNGGPQPSKPALVQACEHNDPEMALLLLERGANPALRGNAKVSALGYAMQNSMLEVMDKIVNVNRSLVNETPNSYEHSPLHIACAKFSEAVVLKLIELGADTTLQDSQGCVPLLYLIYPKVRHEVLHSLFISFPGFASRFTTAVSRKEAKRFVNEILNLWTIESAQKTFPGRSVLEVPLLFGNKTVAKEMINKMTADQFQKAIRILSKRYGRFAMLWMFDLFWTINKAHYHAGAIVEKEVLKIFPMSNLELLRTEVANQGNKFSNARKINEILKIINDRDGINGLSALGGRRAINEWFDLRCQQLLNVIDAYKIGQLEGDAESKLSVLEKIADIYGYCTERWRDEIEQLYEYRPRPADQPRREYYLNDRIMQRFRERRIGIISTKLRRYLTCMHENNLLLDLLRDPLGTRLAVRDDPFQRGWGMRDDKQYHTLPASLKRFQEHESPSLLILDILNHLEISKKLKNKSLDPIDFTKAEIELWLRERVAPYWKEEEYKTLKNKAEAMLKAKSSQRAVQVFLRDYGLDWRIAETVEAATERLNKDIKEFPMKLRRLKAVFPRIDDFKTDAKLPLEDLISLMKENNVEIPSNIKKDREKLLIFFNKKMVDQIAHFENSNKILIALQEKLTAPNTEIFKRNLLERANRLRPAQDLNEVFDPLKLREAVVDTFFRSEVYEEDGELSVTAIQMFLESIVDSSGNSLILIPQNKMHRKPKSTWFFQRAINYIRS